MASMPRTAFIHIGTPKTGTTAIQSRLFAARQQLTDLGYHYLDNCPNHSEPLSTVFWAEKDATKLGKFRWIDDPEAFRRHRAGLRQSLREQIERSAPNHLIISAEGLCEFDDTEARNVIAFLEPHFERIRIIAYAREPQDWMTSACQQATKWLGATLDDLFQKPRTPEHERWFKAFIDAVGDENFDLRAYRSGHEKFDVIDDFCTAIEVETPLHEGPTTGGTNTSVSRQTAIMLSALNVEHPPFVSYRHNPFRAFNLVSDLRLPDQKFALSAETIDLAKETLNSERDWINTALGAEVFRQPDTRHVPAKDWFGEDRQKLESFGKTLSDRCSAAQNEKALKMFLKAQEAENPNLKSDLLGNAWMLSTDRWTMHRIATLAVETGHGDKQKIFIKQRLMKNLEEPQTSDPPLVIGNPFQRDVPP